MRFEIPIVFSSDIVFVSPAPVPYEFKIDVIFKREEAKRVASGAGGGHFRRRATSCELGLRVCTK